jgi:predicted nucleotidyltransferase
MVNNSTIELIKQNLQNLYGNKLEKVLLYGSYARNTADENSDIDLLVVLNIPIIELSKEIRQISKIMLPMILDVGTMISVVPVTKTTFENSQSLFFKNIRKDMIVL